MCECVILYARVRVCVRLCALLIIICNNNTNAPTRRFEHTHRKLMYT